MWFGVGFLRCSYYVLLVVLCLWLRGFGLGAGEYVVVLVVCLFGLLVVLFFGLCLCWRFPILGCCLCGLVFGVWCDGGWWIGVLSAGWLFIALHSYC